MPRRARSHAAGIAYHVVNRAVRRATILQTDLDYRAFEQVLEQALQRVPLELFAYCAMPNHWHLVVRPRQFDDLPALMHWLTGTHARRWHLFHGSDGTGPVYQGRYKSVPIESERQLLRVCRYVERNPVRAGLVQAAQHWRWCSLWRRANADDDRLLSVWPCPTPHDWIDYVNRPETPGELAAMQHLLEQGRRCGRPRKTPPPTTSLKLSPSPF